jgi:hypothetical protein
MKLLLATNAAPALGAFVIVGTLAAVIWLAPPVRRWTLRWPLFALFSFGGLLICGAVGLSRTSLDPFVWSPVLMSGFALITVSCSALVVRAFEWYLWAYWR